VSTLYCAACNEAIAGEPKRDGDGFPYHDAAGCWHPMIPRCEWRGCESSAVADFYNIDTGRTVCLCAEHGDRAATAAGSPWQEC
jgi:hypothetical protein